MYDIKPRQKSIAKKLGLIIKPSENKNKKIDVYNKDNKDNKDKKIASIGGLGYMDYASYIKSIGKKEAEKKRINYLKRHAKEPKEKNGKMTNSKLSDLILWS